MGELINFIANFFLDLRRLSAALFLMLGCGLAIVWISVESINGMDDSESDRWVIGGIVVSLIGISAELIFASVRSPSQYPSPQPTNPALGKSRKNASNSSTELATTGGK